MADCMMDWMCAKCIMGKGGRHVSHVTTTQLEWLTSTLTLMGRGFRLDLIPSTAHIEANISKVIKRNDISAYGRRCRMATMSVDTVRIGYVNGSFYILKKWKCADNNPTAITDPHTRFIHAVISEQSRVLDYQCQDGIWSCSSLVSLAYSSN